MPSGPSGLSAVPSGSSGLSAVPSGPSGLSAVPWGSSGLSAVPSGPSGLSAVPWGSSGLSAVPSGPSGLSAVPSGSSGLSAVPWGSSGLSAVPWGSSGLSAVPSGSSGLSAVPSGSSGLSAVPSGSSGLSAVPSGSSGLSAVPSGSSGLSAVPSGSSGLSAVPSGPSGLSAVPSGSSGLSTCNNGAGSLDELLSIFTGKYTPRQITFIYHLSGNEFESAMDCLLGSISLNSLTSLLQCQMEDKAPTKLFVDLSDVWADGVGYYKCSSLDLTRPIRVIMSDRPAIDTGGVRRQFYTDIFDQFVNNTHMKIFDGSPSWFPSTNVYFGGTFIWYFHHSWKDDCSQYLSRWHRLPPPIPTVLLVHCYW